MESAGQRTTRPPDRLLEALLRSKSTKSAVTMSSKSEVVSETPAKSEPTIADLLDLMTRNAEENRQNFDNLNRHFATIDKRLAAHDDRFLKVEKNVANVRDNQKGQKLVNENTDDKIASVVSDVESLKGVVKQLSENVISQRPFNSTSVDIKEPPLTLPSSPPYMPNNSSLSQTERFVDVVENFNGHRPDLHPEKFLHQLDQYFLYNWQPDAQRIDLFQRRLSGNARIWFDSLMPSPTTYEEIKIFFRQQFWSSATQRQIRNEIFQPYQYRSPRGIARHAMMWIAKAKYLSPPVDPFDLVGIIIQHYPSALGIAIRGRGPRTTNELLAVLTEFEESTSFCDQRSHRQGDHVPDPISASPLATDDRPRNFREQRNRPNFHNRSNHQGNRSYPSRAERDHNANAPVDQINVSGNDDETRV